MTLNIDFPHFTMVRFINDKTEGLAKTRRATGELVINLFYWKKLKPEHQVFILLHEEGHIALNTRDELAADEYAAKRYMNAGFSLTESVKALGDHLSNKYPVHRARTWMQFQRALKFDYHKNNNQKAFRPRYDTTDIVKRKILRNDF